MLLSWWFSGGGGRLRAKKAQREPLERKERAAKVWEVVAKRFKFVSAGMGQKKGLREDPPPPGFGVLSHPKAGGPGRSTF